MRGPRFRIRTLLVGIAIVAVWLAIARADPRPALMILGLCSYVVLSSALFTAAIRARERVGRPASDLELFAIAVGAWAGTYLALFLVLFAFCYALSTMGH